MKKLFILVLSLFCLNMPATASYQQPTYAEEMYALGSIAGHGLACKSKRYHQFELLARAILVGKAPNATVQQEGMLEFNTGKVNAFMEMEDMNFADCAEILKSFDSQPIFKSVLYSDGKIKMYDGSMITPRKPYDASKLYVKDREAFIKADAAYKKYVAEAEKKAQDMEKIPLVDSRYEEYADQFKK